MKEEQVMIAELNMEPGKLKTGYGGGKSDEEWEKS